MRLLITFVGGLGHLTPVVRLARAAQRRGHQVAVAGSGGLVPQVEAAGFTAFATSDPGHHAQSPGRAGRLPLTVMDAPTTEIAFAQTFADRNARRMAGAVPPIIRSFRPDVVLRDETDLGTTVAAELLDVPVASYLLLASGLLMRPELVAPLLDVVRSEHSLTPDPHLTRLTSELALSDMAPSFRSPRAPLPLSPVHYRPLATPPTRSRSGRPRIYVTLGTISNSASGDLFERLVAGLAPLDADTVVTVGRGLDPTDLGATPRNVTVERFIPQEKVLPTVDLVVSHGGSGSLMAALAHGLPSLLLPLGADQPHNAHRATELGLAATLDAATVTPDQITAHTRAALDDVLLRQRCLDVAHEVRSLPDVSTALVALEAVAR